MGRRWWQKEARRIQNEKRKTQDTQDVEVLEVESDAVHHIEAAQEAATELSETVASISEDDLSQVVLTAEQESVEDAKDAEIVTPITVTQNKFTSNNNKKKRR